MELGQDWGMGKGREGGKHRSAPLHGQGNCGGPSFNPTPPPRIPKKLKLLPSIILAQPERKAMAGTALPLPWLPLPSLGDGTKHRQGKILQGLKKRGRTEAEDVSPPTEPTPPQPVEWAAGRTQGDLSPGRDINPISLLAGQ